MKLPSNYAKELIPRDGDGSPVVVNMNVSFLAFPIIDVFSLKFTVRHNQLQCPLGFATLDKAAALDLATATPLTDLRQYINSDLGYSDLEI